VLVAEFNSINVIRILEGFGLHLDVSVDLEVGKFSVRVVQILNEAKTRVVSMEGENSIETSAQFTKETAEQSSQWAQAILAIDEPAIVKYELTADELGDSSESIQVITHLLETARAAAARNLNVMSRIVVPKELVRALSHLKMDQEAAFRQIISGNEILVYNRLTDYSRFMNQKPSITIRANARKVSDILLATDQFGDRTNVSYQGDQNVKVASQIFAAALIYLAEETLSKELFETDSSFENIVRVKSRNALRLVDLVIYTLQSERASEALQARAA
ncbi:MAG: hypothetical protein HY582_04155, partial [Candidatus Omnitrophica bacterium]|nr:hypothetical protein [Candidatus Omnitrophota bacterium]